MTGVKSELHRVLRTSRASLLSKLEGLSEYDMRRPMTPTATNLLGLVKHMTGTEYTIDELDLDAPASVAHWPEERRQTTLDVLLIRMVSETAQHAGHADIIRELIDGRTNDDLTDAATWEQYRARVQAAADSHKSD